MKSRRLLPEASILVVSLLVLAACSGTRPVDTLARDGELSPCPDKPNCVNSTMSDEHHIDPYAIKGDADKAWQALQLTLQQRERTEIITATDNYIHAECTSRLFRFVDDVEFVLRRDSNKIDLRSASRLGYGDLNVNRDRMEDIRSALQKAGVIE